MRQRQRFIVDECNPNDQICEYWLRRTAKDAAKLVPGVGEIFYRVRIPEDMKMEWKSGAGLYVTEDTRTIAEIGYDILMNTWDGRQVVLKPGANIEWLREREKKRWEFQKAVGKRRYTFDDSKSDKSGVTVVEWFAGR